MNNKYEEVNFNTRRSAQFKHKSYHKLFVFKQIVLQEDFENTKSGIKHGKNRTKQGKLCLNGTSARL